MLTDTSVDCRSICRPIYRSRGAQNTHDPFFFKLISVSLGSGDVIAIVSFGGRLVGDLSSKDVRFFLILHC